MAEVTMQNVFPAVLDAYNDAFTVRKESFYLLNKYTYELPAVSLVLYVLFVHFAPGVFRRNNIKWSNIHIQNAWNLFLSVLSVCMFLGIFIPYAADVQRRGLLMSLCDSDHELYEWNEPAVFWVYMFCLSKYAELIDTVFLVLGHKDVPFLHWYHHTTVLAFTWFGFYWQFSAGRIFAMVNALIHSFMYYYYYRMGLVKVDPKATKPSWNKILTVGQISQMVLGIVACGTWMYQYRSGVACACREPEILTVACFLMYGSYLYLFCEFFYFKYISPKKPSAKKTQ